MNETSTVNNNTDINIKGFKVKYQVVRINYHNEDNGYHILFVKNLKFEDEKNNKPNTVPNIIKGYFTNVDIGDKFESFCDWEYHNKYGYQLNANFSKVIYPSSTAGIKRFLMRVVKGIGKGTAQKIVDKYGVKTLETIRSGIETLTCIKGIGENKAKNIYKCIVEHENIEKLSIFLFQKGINNYNDILLIYEKLGEDTLDKIQANPYCLCDFISMSKFPIADKIALNSGIDANSMVRLKKIIVYYVLSTAYSSGHLYVEKDILYSNINIFLARNNLTKITATNEDLDNAIQELVLSKSVFVEHDNDKAYVFLYSLYNDELKTASFIKEMCNDVRMDINEDKINSFFTHYEKVTGIIPEKQQKNAVMYALKYKFSLITGGAGTGKTQTINMIISAIEYFDKKAEVLLCSPTGRASKRMSELTGKEASTIHRALNLTGDENLDTEIAEITADYVICDEGSMVDTPLFFKLMEAVHEKGANFIIVGDKDQLAPVGVGFPFKDLVDSKAVPITILNRLFRQAMESQINKNANLILDGVTTADNWSGLSCDVDKQDFFCFKSNDAKLTQNIIVASIKKLLQCNVNFNDIVVLSSMRSSDIGTIALNKLIQNVFNPADENKKEFSNSVYTFREGDRIMQIKNDYRIEWISYNKVFRNGQLSGEGVFNGDIGHIESIDMEDETVKVIYDDYSFIDGKTVHIDKEVEYTFTQIKQDVILAYAITIHKAQGSEFPCVIMPVGPQLSNLSKNIFYTAVTRAKKRFVIIGDEKSLYQGLTKTGNVLRNTRFKERLLEDGIKEAV